MIVCVCNNVSDRQIRAAVDSGLGSMLEIRQQLQVGVDCGKCHSCAKQVLRQLLGESACRIANQCKNEKDAAVPLLFQPTALAA